MLRITLIATVAGSFVAVYSDLAFGQENRPERRGSSGRFGNRIGESLGNRSVKSESAGILDREFTDEDLQKRKELLQFNREWRMLMEADREELSLKRAERNVKTDLRNYRDQPNAAHIASGDTLNYLLKQLGPKVATVNFSSVSLSPDELASVRLKTTDGITLQRLTQTTDSQGRIFWPEELKAPQLAGSREAVEAAYTKLRDLEKEDQPTDFQAKRLEAAILDLRGDAGTFLRVVKRDEIGANSTRIFLRNLQFRLLKTDSVTKLEQLRIALQPNPKSADELMQHIIRYDLYFAHCEDPAAPAYHVLHDRLAEIHRSMAPDSRANIEPTSK